jgi:hypothetical protein
MTREQLIAAMEKATGPDHDLDLAIARWCFESGGIAGVDYDPELWLIRNGGEFTGLIDAALTLVPESAYWNLLTDGAGDGYQAAVVSREGADRGERLAWVGGATPAIALCIASLKARAP